MEAITKFLINIVKKSAKLINNDLKISAKGEKGDLVTNFDFSIEKFLIENISKRYPDFDIISEETSNNKKLSDNCFTKSKRAIKNAETANAITSNTPYKEPIFIFLIISINTFYYFAKVHIYFDYYYEMPINKSKAFFFINLR